MRNLSTSGESHHLTKFRALVQFALGMAQMAGAVATATLLVQTGVNRITLAGTLVTGLLTLTSRLFFPRRASSRR